eukprot:CAMPEP_0183351766 /NCGR_PEP_ID=MMETSP0164_2-20130417/26241_1 /TAXON_ID=221442 /ORGANISM="Coccolithus pelagicus ssp braarudi, Strain PLY182g" /LENGTH=79 /DNA_ID=CAMNT_0025524033 /DNA_START=380 /DNA_END=615 /DNA_ORIENTATION=+
MSHQTAQINLWRAPRAKKVECATGRRAAPHARALCGARSAHIHSVAKSPVAHREPWLGRVRESEREWSLRCPSPTKTHL